MQLQKQDNDLRKYFQNIFGKSGKLVLNTTQTKDDKDMAQVLTRAQEAAQMYGFGPEGALKQPDTKLILITTNEGVDEVFEEVRQTKVCAFDTETTGFDHYSDLVVSYQISPRPGVSYYFPLNHKGYDKNLDYKYCMDKMGHVLGDPEILKVGHNLKFDYKWWYLLGFEAIENVHDTLVMAFILDENRPYGYSLKDIVQHELKIKMLKFSDLNIWEKHKKYKEGMLRDFSELSVYQAMPYACPDTDMSLRLENKFWPLIEKEEFRHLFNYVETPLMFTLARMELKGMKVDVDYLRALHGPFTNDIERLNRELEQAAADAGFENPADKKGNREPFNPASPAQVGEFTKLLGLTTGKFSKKTGKMSVDKKGRDKLADKHPAFKMMNELAEKQKTFGTYIEPLANEHLNKVTGRVHSSFHQTGAETGRLSSSSPNMQNIPKKYGTLVRQGFIPEPGYRFVRADYSQIELKIVAHMSRCQALIDAFIRGDDVHSAVAIKAFKLEEKFPGITPAALKASKDKAVKIYRDRAKAVSFGILYGTTSYGLSKNLGCSMEEAQKLIDDFYVAFPELRAWIDKTIRFAHAKGYVETMLKRRRRFVKDQHGGYRFGMERAAQNTPVQGTSADITKWAMIQVEKALSDHDARLVLQVHDELIVECREDQVDEVQKIMVDEMEKGLAFFGLPLLIPTSVECDIQVAWGINCDKCTACNTWSAVEEAVLDQTGNELKNEQGKVKNILKCRNCNAQH